MLFTIISCTKNDEDPIEREKRDPLELEQVIDTLNDAYASNSISKLEEFLDVWYKDVRGISTTQISKDIEEDIYRLFQEFYNPFNISRLGYHEWGEMYEGLEYVVVQNSIVYDFRYDSINITKSFRSNDTEYDSITDFRPVLEFEDAKVLYLTETYAAALNMFLGSDYFPFEEYGLEPPELTNEEINLRYNFLQNSLAIVHGHWGLYWHIETHPFVFSIHLNEDVTKALLYFRVGYMFGEAELKKENGNWLFVRSAITGIE